MCLRQLLQSSQLQRAWRAAFLKHIQGRHPGAWRWTHSGGGPYRAVIFDMGGVLLPSPGRVAAGPLELLQFDHGQSNPTYYVKPANHQLVLRKKPPRTLLPSVHAVEREFRMMEALVNAGAHKPKVLHLCEESSIVTNPFYLMEYCPGLINKDPSPPGLEPSQRRAIYIAMNRVLCKIHSVDLKAVGLEDCGKHGQASSATVKQTGKLTEFMCNLAWDFPIKEGFQVFKEMLATKPLMGSHHSWSRPQSLLSTPGMRSYVTSTDSSPAHASKGALIFSPEGLPPRVRELNQRLKEFMERHVYPAELELQRHQVSAERWTPSPLVEDLKEKAKAEGLWNLFLPLETDPEKKYGAGLTNVEYAHLCEVMGTSLYAPEIFNCSAPDTGNMELLVRYGTEEQKARWLIPLLEGKARSCFAMTEPQVASSDATNIESSIREEDSFYVINGHKWWITGPSVHAVGTSPHRVSTLPQKVCGIIPTSQRRKPGWRSDLSHCPRHPGSSLPALRVYGKNRPTCPTPPVAVHVLGSHGYPRDKNHPASEGVWAGGRTRWPR
ncbi:acyl-CoA dehydrogenase family member 10-like isoform X1 [Bos javanicus]|uniref:acyl-CoA dehydrogenase family member 10-like isoform X1 n=1 Tax=Bos javanicus TaxID=9906 RepID=UPI002AA6302F|nr:acyl-CoA dehydrogenase family member 10-like isoform X1 [Bos javanicus]